MVEIGFYRYYASWGWGPWGELVSQKSFTLSKNDDFFDKLFNEPSDFNEISHTCKTFQSKQLLVHKFFHIFASFLSSTPLKCSCILTYTSATILIKNGKQSKMPRLKNRARQFDRLFMQAVKFCFKSQREQKFQRINSRIVIRLNCFSRIYHKVHPWWYEFSLFTLAFWA